MRLRGDRGLDTAGKATCRRRVGGSRMRAEQSGILEAISELIRTLWVSRGTASMVNDQPKPRSQETRGVQRFGSIVKGSNYAGPDAPD